MKPLAPRRHTEPASTPRLATPSQTTPAILSQASTVLRTVLAAVFAFITVTAAPLLAQTTPEQGAPHGKSVAQHTCGHGSEGGKDQGSGGSCPMHGNGRGGQGGMGKRGEAGHMERRGGPGGMAGRSAMRTAMTLVHEHRDAIEREVEDIENGVITTTWSALDAEAARTLERHVVEMKAALEKGETVRGWDPLFAEIFQHYDEIEMVIETIEGGVRVTETSDNPEVVKLIQAHARKVNEFLERGPAAVHEETPLPEGYVDTRPQD